MRSGLPKKMIDHPVIVHLPEAGEVDLRVIVEILVQERVAVFSSPVSRCSDHAELRRFFASRASFGVHEVCTQADCDVATEFDADFVSLRPDADEGLLPALVDAQIPTLVPALTPTEIAQAHANGASAALIIPADVLGPNYPDAVNELLPATPIVAQGGVSPYQARRWLHDANAVAVVANSALLGDAMKGGSLSDLRARAQSFADLMPRRGDGE